MLEEKLLGSKEDRKFYDRDHSMLEMPTQKSRLKLDKENLKMFALFVLWIWKKYVVLMILLKIHIEFSNYLKHLPEVSVDS